MKFLSNRRRSRNILSLPPPIIPETNTTSRFLRRSLVHDRGALIIYVVRGRDVHDTIGNREPRYDRLAETQKRDALPRRTRPVTLPPPFFSLSSSGERERANKELRTREDVWERRGGGGESRNAFLSPSIRRGKFFVGGGELGRGDFPFEDHPDLRRRGGSSLDYRAPLRDHLGGRRADELGESFSKDFYSAR